MDAEDFLRAIVPPEGIKYLGVLSPDRERPAHYQYNNVGQMAEAAAQWDAKGAEVYFALSSYAPPVQATDKQGNLVFHEDTRPKMLKRTAKLALWTKSFWVDLDCGAGKPYPDQDAAFEGLTNFIAASECPFQPVVVNSGGGLHCYWPLDTAINATSWQGWAKQWRKVLTHFELHSDPQRDTDVASILRVPGTTNRKLSYGRPVEIRQEGEVAPAVAFFQWLAGHARTIKVEVPAKRKSADGLGVLPSFLAGDDEVNAELASRAQLPKSSAHEIVKHCAQLRMVASVRGNVVEPVWRAMLGLVKHCSEGEALAHEWSSGHPEYNAADTDAKLEGWTAGPATCAVFREHNPSLCEGCPHAGNITSPIQLGVQLVERQALQVYVPVAAGEEQVQEVVLPRGYIYDGSNNTLCRQVRNEDGVYENVPFARTLFHGVTRIRTTEGKYEMRFRVYPDGRAPREFTVPTGEITAGGATLTKLLGDYEVIPTLNKGAATFRHAYLIDEVARLQKEGLEMVTFNQFGWQEEGTAFLLGDRLYRASGVTEVLLADGLAQRKEVGLMPGADAARWSELVQELYGMDQMEPYQYAFAASFGSALVDFFGTDYHGAALCFTGGTGDGKTAASLAAVSVWGKADEMKLAQVEGATWTARIHRHGAYKSLPLLHDELSTMSADEARRLLYAIANGQGRARMDNTGLVERDPPKWKSHSIITSNTHLNELVSTGKGGDIATAVRNFEVQMEDYSTIKHPRPWFAPRHKELLDHGGAAGEVFVKFLVSHRKEVYEKLVAVESLLIKKLPVLGSDTRFRMYRMHAQASFTAFLLAKSLKLLSFDANKLFSWIIAHTGRLCDMAAEADDVKKTSMFTQMVSDLAHRTLVTYNFLDNRTTQMPEDPAYPVRGDVAARYILGTHNMPAGQAWYAGKLLVSARALREWAQERGVRTKAVLEDAASLGIYMDGDDVQTMFVLTRGTTIPGGQHRCYVFDVTKLDDLPPEFTPERSAAKARLEGEK